MRTNCPICNKSFAKTTSEIFLGNKNHRYYGIIITWKEERIHFPACLNCNRRVAREDFFNRTGSAWIAASFVFAGIGLFAISIDFIALFSGDKSSFFQMTPIGLFFLIPSIWAFWRCFKARREIGKYLSLLGYAQQI